MSRKNKEKNSLNLSSHSKDQPKTSNITEKEMKIKEKKRMIKKK